MPRRINGPFACSPPRSVRKFRDEGIAGFFQPRRGRGATVLSPETAQQAQALLFRGLSRSQVAEQLVKANTFALGFVPQ
jgi:hypothetical protein